VAVVLDLSVLVVVTVLLADQVLMLPELSLLTADTSLQDLVNTLFVLAVQVVALVVVETLVISAAELKVVPLL
jgi:hypothetical protein